MKFYESWCFVKNGIYEGYSGAKYHYLNNEIHREDGPAVEFTDGTKHWYFNGKLHNIHGPAIINADGSEAWSLNDELINCSSQKEFERLMRLKAFW